MLRCLASRNLLLQGPVAAYATDLVGGNGTVKITGFLVTFTAVTTGSVVLQRRSARVEAHQLPLSTRARRTIATGRRWSRSSLRGRATSAGRAR